MKRLIIIKSFLIFIFFVLLQNVLYAKVPTVKLNLLNSVGKFNNGDRLILTAAGFAQNDEIVAVILYTYDENNELKYKIQKNHHLKIDKSGNLTGDVILSGLVIKDRIAQIGISTKLSTVIPTRKFGVSGNLSEPLTIEEVMAGTFSFSETVVDNQAALGEDFTIDTPNSGWISPVIACVRREYSSGDGSGTPIAIANLAIDGLSIDEFGQLSGTVNNGYQTYNASTNTMRLDVMDFSFSFGTSGNYLPVVKDITRPKLTTVIGVALDTLRLIFDEPVRESDENDAADKFTLTGGITASAFIPVGGSVTDTWNLIISGLEDRGLSGVNVGYNSGSPGATLVEDPYGNEVMTTTPTIDADDQIPPDVTTLRDSSNTVLMNVGEFLGDGHKFNARVTKGNLDNSLAGVEFQGSNDTLSWTSIGTDNSGTLVGDDLDFSYDWSTPSPAYRVFRARAFDNDGNSTYSTKIGSLPDGFNNNFRDTYRAVIREVTPDPIGASQGAIRTEIVIEIQDNYGSPKNSTSSGIYFEISETSTATEKWWETATGGTSSPTKIGLTISSSATEGSRWYSNETVGGPYTLVLTEPAGVFTEKNGYVTSDGKTITIILSNIVTVSGYSPTVDSNIDTISTTAGQLNLQVSVSGGEQTNDDFRFRWGFSKSAIPGSYGTTGQSGDLSPPSGGGVVVYGIPPEDLQNLGDLYSYLYYWLENIGTGPSVLDGFPIEGDPARLVINPRLQTTGGDNGSDVVQGDFTPGENNQTLVSIKFTGTIPEATIKISGIIFEITPTSTAANSVDLSAFHLYKDGGVIGTYEPASDLLLKNFNYSIGRAISFTNIAPPLSISGSGAHVLVTVDIKSGADPSHTLGMVLSDTNQVTLAPDQVVNGDEESIKRINFSNIGTSMDYSLPVTLSTFTATAGYGKIILSWVTSSENNNAGFYVMRAEEEKGIYNQMNHQIIQGYGNTTMEHQYRYVDTNVEIGRTYYYKLYSQDFNGDIFQYPVVESTAALAVPETFALQQNFPNPFNPTTKITFSVPQEANVKLEIYNMLGQKIRTLVDGQFEAGIYEDVMWDATDNKGNPVANGVYYLVLISNAQDFKQVRKMVFMK
jgi:hypothetical protein